MATYFDTNIVSSITANLSKPRKSLSASPIGLKFLDQNNDVFFNSYIITYGGQVLTSETASITSFTTHSNSSNSGYAYAITNMLLVNNFISRIPLTSGSTSLSVYFRGSNTAEDFSSDYRLNLGKVGVISLKKSRYGDRIKELSFTAVTTNGLMFKDSFSASKAHGIITKTTVADTSWANPLTAGIIFYDTGVVAILGESISSINSLSSLSSVNYNSDMKINNLTVMCTVLPTELNYSTNDSAFYNSSVTSDPDDSSDLSLSAFSASGFNWGAELPGALHSKFYLKNYKNRNPYITTVGLFNDKNEMLMVAKLAQPIIKSKQMPMTIKISYDF